MLYYSSTADEIAATYISTLAYTQGTLDCIPSSVDKLNRDLGAERGQNTSCDHVISG